MIEVTDATFEEAVLQRSAQVPVVVDLWAPWCGPCRTLGPILERVVEATGGAVELAKVNVDENPSISAGFQVQSIPAVFAVRDGAVVDGFVGAQPESVVTEFVAKLAPAPSEADLLVEEARRSLDPDGDGTGAGTADGASPDGGGAEGLLRRALDLQPDHEEAITTLAGMLVAGGRSDEALALLRRIPESPETRRLQAEARLAAHDASADRADGDGVEGRLDALLERVRDDEAARQEFLDLLETLGSDDARTTGYRKALAGRLF